MKLTIWGGAGEHGRACFLVEAGGLKVLLDCGVINGKTKHYPLFDPELIRQLDAVFISHLHDDHFGALPGLAVAWGRSGHAPGAVWLLLSCETKTILYTGDWSPHSALLRHDPIPGNPLLAGRPIDLALADCAYGTVETHWENAFLRLTATIAKVLAAGGTVLLPLPRLGRGQDLMVLLREAFPEAELAVEADLYQGLREAAANSELLRPESAARIDRALAANLIVVSEEREREQAAQGRRIVLTTDSRLESAAARSYLRRLGGDPRHGLIITGHLEKELLPAILFAGGSRLRMKVYRRRFPIHQGISDLRALLNAVRIGRTLPVHAAQKQTDRVCRRLASEGYPGLISLSPGQSLEV